MTIKQFAQEHGISEQAVYQKLRKQGLKVDKLKNTENASNKSELSDEGLNTLNKLFERRLILNQVDKQVSKQIERLETENAQLKNQLATATAEAEQLTGKVKELETENARLTGKLEAYETTSATLTDALTAAQRIADQAQQLHAMQIKALPGGGIKSWFSKLFKKGDGE